MRSEDLDLNEIVELDPGGGTFRVVGQRVLVFDAVSHGNFRKKLIDSIGERTARGILNRHGYIRGRRLAEILKNKFKWDSDEDWQKAGARLYALQGLFMLESDDPIVFGPEGGTLRDSYEAEQHIHLMGRSDNPVCWNLCGLISGYLSFTTGKEMVALEDKCVGMGDPACHVIIKTEEEWGSTVSGELAVFKRVGIEDALREVTAILKHTENDLREKTRMLATLAKIDEDPAELMVRSSEMRHLMELAKTAAAIESTVLITGEKGTGKERVARFVHNNSFHSDGPFIAVNCGAITEKLLESELFGHAHEAFTGATADRPGLFEAANGGTLFLDEVGEITLPMQTKIYRVLLEGEVMRVGEIKSRPIHVRVVSASNKDLAAEVAEKRFREDLYHQIKVVELVVPPLHQRREDILPLARLLIAEAALQMKRPVYGMTATAADQLLGYAWPGNVRELANVIERAVAVAKENRVNVEDLPPEVRLVVPLISNKGEVV
jgi:predicted hydrocarbon binding protein/MoxR-like ATPase